jgi:hypothetical protein
MISVTSFVARADVARTTLLARAPPSRREEDIERDLVSIPASSSPRARSHPPFRVGRAETQTSHTFSG